jgi:hypothetical protein
MCPPTDTLSAFGQTESSSPLSRQYLAHSLFG